MHQPIAQDPSLRPIRSMRTLRNRDMASVFEMSSMGSSHLMFSTTGEMGQEATTFYKKLADMLAWKEQKPYNVVISWLRCKLSFAAVRSSCASMGQGHPTTDPYVRPTLPSQHPRMASHEINSSTIQFFHLFSHSLSQYIYIYPSGFVLIKNIWS